MKTTEEPTKNYDSIATDVVDYDSITKDTSSSSWMKITVMGKKRNKIATIIILTVLAVVCYIITVAFRQGYNNGSTTTSVVVTTPKEIIGNLLGSQRCCHKKGTDKKPGNDLENCTLIYDGHGLPGCEAKPEYLEKHPGDFCNYYGVGLYCCPKSNANAHTAWLFGGCAP